MPRNLVQQVESGKLEDGTVLVYREKNEDDTYTNRVHVQLIYDNGLGGEAREDDDFLASDPVGAGLVSAADAAAARRYIIACLQLAKTNTGL